MTAVRAVSPCDPQLCPVGHHLRDTWVVRSVVGRTLRCMMTRSGGHGFSSCVSFPRMSAIQSTYRREPLYFSQMIPNADCKVGILPNRSQFVRVASKHITTHGCPCRFSWGHTDIWPTCQRSLSRAGPGSVPLALLLPWLARIWTKVSSAISTLPIRRPCIKVLTLFC